jgi:hypothetical protein
MCAIVQKMFDWLQKFPTCKYTIYKKIGLHPYVAYNIKILPKSTFFIGFQVTGELCDT